MSIHLDIFKVMTCLTVIGLTAASGYPAQAQQQNCNQQTGQNCMKGPNVDPNTKPQGGDPYGYGNLAPPVGSGQVTPTNPQTNPQSKPNSGNSN